MGRSELIDGCRVTWSDAGIALSGEIDERNADLLENRLSEDLEGAVTVLDLHEVTFFGAAGVHFLTRLGAAARDADTLVHVLCPPHVWRVLNLFGGADLPGLVLDREDAPDT